MRSRVARRVGGAGLILVVVGAILFAARRESPDPRLLPTSLVRADVPSNILPIDYSGSDACASCHKKNYDLWMSHPHRTMNQHPSPETVRGDFNNANLTAGRGVVNFRRDASRYLMTVSKDNVVERVFVVTRTIGGRHMQFYAGRMLKGPEKPDDPAWQGEFRLPFAYWYRFKRWLPIHYFDQGNPEELYDDGRTKVMGVDGLSPHSYSGNCMNCHNTMPYVYRIFRPQLVGFPAATVSADPFTLSNALSDVAEVLPTIQDFGELNTRLDADRHLVQLGIACESCHFGAKEHARTEGALSFLPTNGALRIAPDGSNPPYQPTRKDPRTIVGICTQCHCAAVATWPNGVGVPNSREGLDLAGGHCASQISCTNCHEPHTAGEPSGLTLTPKHVSACLQCHPKYKSDASAAAHARHTFAQANCLDCHMPRHSQGIEELSHAHRVVDPVEPSMAAEAAPNACNLCHLDKSLHWTLSELKKGWGREIKPEPSWASKYGGSLDNPVGPVWLASDDGAKRLVGAAAYGRSPAGKKRMPDLLRAMNDAVPANRAYAQLAVERVIGRTLTMQEFDQVSPPAERKRQIEVLLQTLGRQ